MSLVKIGTVHAHNVAASPESRVHYIQPTDWPAGRQLALMRLRRTPFVLPVVAKLERSTVRPIQADWRWLIANNHCTNVPHVGWKCTGIGASTADELAFHHAHELGMHLFKVNDGRFDLGLSCTCGHSVAINRNAGHITSQIIAAQGRHLEAVENGTWKPLAQILDDVIKRIQDCS